MRGKDSLPEEDSPGDAPPPELPLLAPRDFRTLSELIHGASGVRLGADKQELLASRLRLKGR